MIDTIFYFLVGHDIMFFACDQCDKLLYTNLEFSVKNPIIIVHDLLSTFKENA